MERLVFDNSDISSEESSFDSSSSIDPLLVTEFATNCYVVAGLYGVFGFISFIGCSSGVYERIKYRSDDARSRSISDSMSAVNICCLCLLLANILLTFVFFSFFTLSVCFCSEGVLLFVGSVVSWSI